MSRSTARVRLAGGGGAVASLAVAAVLAAGCDGSEAPAAAAPVVTLVSPQPMDAVAGQDGDGPWQPLAHENGGYRLQLRAGGRFSLAFVCRATGIGEVIHAHSEELSTIHVPCGDPLAGHALPAASQRWQGAIRGAGPGAEVTVSFGIHDVGLAAEVTGAGYRIDLRPGSYDLLAVARQPDGSSRVILARAVEVAGPGGRDLDFGAAGALVPRDTPLALPAGTPGERMEAAVMVTTGRGARGAIASPAAGRAALLDDAALGPDDNQSLLLFTASGDGAQLRGLTRSVGDGALPPLELPPPLTGASASLAATAPVSRPRAAFQPQAGPLFYQLDITSLAAPTPAATPITWVVNASARWLGHRAAIELPDLSGAPGFSAAHGPAPGAPLLIYLTAVTSNRRLDVLLDGARPGRGDFSSYAKTLAMLPARP
jgi:hypothetical protein